jgi:hypothetical protein
MKRSLYLLIAIGLIGFASCKNKKAAASGTAPVEQTTSTPTTTTTAPDAIPPVETAPNQTEPAPLPAGTLPTYRVTISFISKGEGIDIKSQETLENWLKNQPKTPKYEKTHWGREGETNYCLKLDELSTREQEIFVRDLRTLLTDKPLILISEYAECKGTPE